MNATKTLHQFNTITDEITSLFHQAAGKMGLSDSEMLILYLMYDHGETISQSDIIDISGISKQTINSAVNNMEKKEWIFRAERSGRKRCLHFTETGLAIVRDIIKPFHEQEESIFHDWTEEERQIFLDLNVKYTEALREIVEKMPVQKITDISGDQQ